MKVLHIMNKPMIFKILHKKWIQQRIELRQFGQLTPKVWNESSLDFEFL